MLEIHIERDSRKAQLAFDFAPLPAEQLEEQGTSDVRGAATLFLSREHNLPYYFGGHCLALCASASIEQFLWLAGDAFEELISAGAISGPVREVQPLTPTQQHTIVKSAAEARWRDIPLRIPDGRRVRAFLEVVGQFARSITYQPNAPYAPGVTGIAINMRDRVQLLDADYRKLHPPHAELARLLSLALAHNLLEPILDHSQGPKGERWMVLYLNRFLCVRFDLPLQYGGGDDEASTNCPPGAADGIKALKKSDDLLGNACRIFV